MAGRSRNRAAASRALVRSVDLRPLYQRSRALFGANAPHVRARYRLGRRVHGPGPSVRVRGRSDPDPFSFAAHCVAVADCLAIPSVISIDVPFARDEPDAAVFGKPIGVTERVTDAERFAVGQRLCIAARLASSQRVANARTVGIRVTRADAVCGGARGRACA